MSCELLGKMKGLDKLLGVPVTDEQNEMVSRVVRTFFFMFEDSADIVQFYHAFGMEGFKKLYLDCKFISDNEARLNIKNDELLVVISQHLAGEIEARKAYNNIKSEWCITLSVIRDQLEFYRRNFSGSQTTKEGLNLWLENLENFVLEAIRKEV